MIQSKENAEILNQFFSNAVKNLKISRFFTRNLLVYHIPHSILKDILKFQNYSSVSAVRNAASSKTVSFLAVSFAQFFKEIVMQDTSNSTQSSDIPTKILKENF